MRALKFKYIIIPNPTKTKWYYFIFLLGGLLEASIPDLLNDKFHLCLYPGDCEEKGEEKQVKEGMELIGAFLTQSYIEMTINVVVNLVMVFPHFYYTVINKKEYKKREQELFNIIIQNKHIMNIKDRKRHLFMVTFIIVFVISFVDITCQLLDPINKLIEYATCNEIKDDHKDLNSILFIDIFARYFFSRCILKTYFYYHHKLSILLNFIGIIFLILAEINLIKTSFNTDSTYVGFVILRGILYSFEDIMNKFAFLHVVLLPCSLIFYDGVVELVFLAIFTILLHSLNLYDSSHYNIRNVFKNILIHTPFNVMRNLFLMKVIDKFSPQHMSFLTVSETIAYYIYNLISNFNDVSGAKETKDFILEILGFLILLIATLIHNEIIIINTLKLKMKTEYYLNKDVDSERIGSFASELSKSSDFEDNSFSINDLTGSFTE